MRDTQQQQQWARHLADEREALRAQQADAGATHEPVAGPLPHSADDVSSATRVERERCAAIAEAWSDEGTLRATFADFTEWELRAATEVARTVARAIRSECP